MRAVDDVVTGKTDDECFSSHSFHEHCPWFAAQVLEPSSGTFQPHLHQNPYLNYRLRLSVGTKFQFSDLSIDMIETNH